LQEKRLQARQWLDRLKRCFPKGGGSVRGTRKAVADPSSGHGEKLLLSEVKLMVTEGEQLYEERRSRELNKALNVVEAAEEVRGLTLTSPAFRRLQSFFDC